MRMKYITSKDSSMFEGTSLEPYFMREVHIVVGDYSQFFVEVFTFNNALVFHGRQCDVYSSMEDVDSPFMIILWWCWIL